MLAPVVERYLGRPVPGGVTSLRMDHVTALIIVAVGMLVVLACSVVPAWVARATPAGAMSATNLRSATDGPASQRARGLLIAIEVAACLTLLIGAGLTLESAVRVLRVDMGFQAEDVVVGRYNLRPRAYPDADAHSAFHQRVLERAVEMPEVQSVALTTSWPLQQSLTVEISRADTREGRAPAGIVAVTPEYFSLLRIPLVSGRTFTMRDRLASQPVALVSRTLATRLWRDAEPVGRPLQITQGTTATGESARVVTVVGVVGDVRHSHTDDDAADVYVPLLQSPSPAVFAYLRMAGNRPAAEREFQQLLGSIDHDVGFAAARPLAEILDQQRAGARLLASILVVFAAFAAVLALVGVYGVIASTVKQREREIAIRIAIGADRQTITRLFVAQGAAVLAAGLTMGIAGAPALGRVLQSQLFDVRPSDPVVMAVATAAFAVCGLLAIASPARAAAAIDPVRLLKD